MIDPASIGLYLELFGSAVAIVHTLRDELRTAGVTDEQLAAITLDYDTRIARRQAEEDADQG